MADFAEDFEIDPRTTILFEKYLGITDDEELRKHVLETASKLKTVRFSIFILFPGAFLHLLIKALGKQII